MHGLGNDSHKVMLRSIVSILLVGAGIAAYSLFDFFVANFPYDTSAEPFRSLLYAFTVALDTCAILLLLAILWGSYFFRKKVDDLSKEKTSFVAIASHELRSPLTAIRWSLAELRADAAISPESRTIVNGIYDRVCGLIDLTGTFMLTASADHGMRAQDLKVINISPIVCESAARARSVTVTKKITLVCDPAFNSSIVVRGDPLRLRLVFDNLISNAIKYSREGTTVSVGFIDSGSMKTFAIQDQGIGIPKEDISKVFGGFYRAANAKRPSILGTGFGLFMVKKIIDFHGGSITCESEINRGTTFYINLPSA